MKLYLSYLCAIALACGAMENPAYAQASALGGSFPIYAATARGSAVAYDSKNHVYLVVSAYGAVNGRFVSADGQPLPTCISSGTSFVLGGGAFGHFPRVAYSPDANGGVGGFMVTWHEADSPAGGNAVHARSVSIATCLGANRIISNTVDGGGAVIGADKTWWEAGAPIVYSPGSQRWLVAWRAIASANGSPDDINARLLDLTGQPLGPGPTKVTQTGIYEDNVSLAYNPATDQFLVAFVGYDSSAFVAARLMSASSGALGPQYELSRAGGTYISDATFIVASGKFFVSWYQLPGGTTGRLVNGSTGVPEGSIIPLSTRFAANDALSIAYNPVSGTTFLVSHDQASSEDGGLEISAAGVPSGGFGATSIGGKGNFYPRIAASTIEKKWMLATSNVFQTIYGQFIQTTSGGGGVSPPPPPPPAALSVSFGANVNPPINLGTTVTWTANASGGTGPYRYQFWKYTTSGGWELAQDYSASNTFSWAPPAGTSAVQVWVRNAGSSAAYDAYASSGNFTTSGAARITSISANRSFPVPLHVPVTWTVNATSSTGPVQYQFWRYSASTGWILARDYSSNNTYTWFPLEGVNALQVWVRTAGSSAAYEDYRSTGMFTVSSGAAIQSFTSNVRFPVAPGTLITFTAAATSGGGPVEYKFWGYNASVNKWAVMRDWGAINQLSWTPSQAGAYAVQVWVRVVGAEVEYQDYRGTELFSVSGISTMTFTPNRSLSGLRAGDVVTWTTQLNGGAGNWEYEFWGYNGSSWILLQPYTLNQSMFSWGMSPGVRAIQVWVRAPGSTATYEAYASSGMFTITP